MAEGLRATLGDPETEQVILDTRPPEVIIREISAVEITIPPHRTRLARVDENGCWIWLGYIAPDGYGRIGKNRPAHRVVYEAVHGPVGPLVIDHLCRVRACVNPAHLEAVTSKENILRGESFSAQLHRQTTCKRGHAFDEANTYRAANGSRACRRCRHAAVRRYRRKKKAL